MATVAGLRFCFQVTDIILPTDLVKLVNLVRPSRAEIAFLRQYAPKADIQQIIAANNELLKLADKTLYRVKLTTHLINLDGLAITNPRSHDLPIGHPISYGPLTTDINVMGI